MSDPIPQPDPPLQQPWASIMAVLKQIGLLIGMLTGLIERFQGLIAAITALAVLIVALRTHSQLGEIKYTAKSAATQAAVAGPPRTSSRGRLHHSRINRTSRRSSTAITSIRIGRRLLNRLPMASRRSKRPPSQQNDHIGLRWIEYDTGMQNLLPILADISINGLVNIVVWLVVIGCIFWLLWWLIGYIAPPEPFAKIARVIVALVAVIALIRVLLMLANSSALNSPFTL